ncbi:MAG: type III PLP-dependent enzyme [Rhodospirillaceae bacterium]|jgi:ornithine decarboxylase|nr:type III PLP-dependent enzyme [Rhodospirillaceae bacterium]
MNDPRFAPERKSGDFVRHFDSVRAMVSALRPVRPVYCLAPAALTAAAARFRDGFSGDSLYAVKCNPHPFILRTLYDSGVTGFDAASIAEVAAARAVHPDATIGFLNPVKPRGDIREAYRFHGVRLFVVDHESEFEKIAAELGTAADVTILVRFATAPADALYELSNKFGAGADDAARLLAMVAARGWSAGLAFHVGSQCKTPSAYTTALVQAGDIARQSGVKLACVDVGGGFPADYVGETPPPLQAYFDAIADGVQQAGLTCRLICEPGRALVASACSLIVQVQLRKGDDLYINDGVYHSLSEMITGGLRYPVRLVRLDGEASSGRGAETNAFRMFGPTCDSTDVLPAPFELPQDVREGDWIEIGQMGAYSNAVSTRFNGIWPDDFVTVDAF